MEFGQDGASIGMYRSQQERRGVGSSEVLTSLESGNDESGTFDCGHLARGAWSLSRRMQTVLQLKFLPTHPTLGFVLILNCILASYHRPPAKLMMIPLGMVIVSRECITRWASPRLVHSGRHWTRTGVASSCLKVRLGDFDLWRQISSLSANHPGLTSSARFNGSIWRDHGNHERSYFQWGSSLVFCFWVEWLRGRLTRGSAFTLITIYLYVRC